jgi:hypothetical protein
MKTNRFPALVILTGQHMGAIVPLHAGVFHIGCGSMCDIVLREVDIADNHAAMTIGKNTLKLQAINGFVFRYPRPWRFITFSAVPLDEVFMVGNVAMVITADSENSKNSETFAETQQRFSQQVYLIQAALKRAKKRELKPLLTKRVITTASVLALTGVAAVAAGHIEWRAEHNAISKRADAKNTEAEALAGFGAAQELTVLSIDGTTNVSGYVPSWHDYVQLKAKLNSQDAPSKVRVFVVDELVKHASALLTAGSHNVSIAYGGHGVLRISGTTNDAEKFKTQVSALPRLLPGVISVDTSGITTEVSALGQLAKRGAPRVANQTVNGLMSGSQRYFSSGDTRFIAGGAFDKDLIVQSIDADKITFQHQGQPWVMKLSTSGSVQIR